MTFINYNPEGRGRRIPVLQWLGMMGMMGKTRHLLKAEHDTTIQAFEREVEWRWRRLKVMHEHPLL